MTSSQDQDQIQHLTKQETELRFPHFDDTLAFELGNHIRNNFLDHYDTAQYGIVISISLFTGHTLFACAVGHSVGPDNWDWVRHKNKTVQRYGCSSYLVGSRLRLKGKDINSLGDE